MTLVVDVVVGRMSAALAGCLRASIESFRALGVRHERAVTLLVGMGTHSQVRDALTRARHVVVVPAWGRPVPRGADLLLARADVVCALDARQLGDLPLGRPGPGLTVSGLPDPDRGVGAPTPSRFASALGAADHDGVALIGGDGVDDVARVRCALHAGIVPILDRRSPYAPMFQGAGALVPPGPLEALELAEALSHMAPVRAALVDRLRGTAMRRHSTTTTDVAAAWIESVVLAGHDDPLFERGEAFGTLAAT